MGRERLRCRRDGVSIGPWSPVGALTLSGAIGSGVVVDSTYIGIRDPVAGQYFTCKLGRPRHNPTKEELMWFDLRARRLTGSLTASLKIALYQGEPLSGILLAESDDITIRPIWCTHRVLLGEAADVPITDFNELWVRIRVSRALERGELAISLIELRNPEEERNWKLAANEPPLTPKQIDVIASDGEEYTAIKYDGEWSFDDGYAFESPARHVKQWSDE